MAKFQYINLAGEVVSADVSLTDYKAAAKCQKNLSQYLQAKYGSDADCAKYGSVFKQACQSVGIHKPNAKLGINSPTIAEIVGDMSVDGGSFTAPNGEDNNTPAGRLFYPEVIMEIIREKLEEDHSDILTGFDKMIALKQSIPSEIWVQPMIDVSAPEANRSEQITQLALPKAMVSITSSQIGRSIPTKSIGLMISEQAMNYATLDLVGIAVAAQSRGERIAQLYENITSLLNGDIDVGAAALAQKKAQEFDVAITTAGEVTHKAFLHMLHDNIKTLSIDSMICDLDTYLAFENRTNRPTVDKDRATDSRLDATINRINTSLDDLNVLIVDSDVLGANTALMLDSAYAIRKITNTNASYSAVESYVMMRSRGLRIDYGTSLSRLYDEAFQAVNLTVA